MVETTAEAPCQPEGPNYSVTVSRRESAPPLMSRGTGQLFAALAAATAEFTHAARRKSNPYFNSKYAELSDVIDSCRPALSKHGLVVIQPIATQVEFRYLQAPIQPRKPNEPAPTEQPMRLTKVTSVTITTMVCHKSGEWISSALEFQIADDAKVAHVQQVGSAVTYGRRYGLSSILGLATEDDDDGNVADRKTYEQDQIRSQGPASAASPPTGDRQEAPLAPTVSKLLSIDAVGDVLGEWQERMKVSSVDEVRKLFIRPFGAESLGKLAVPKYAEVVGLVLKDYQARKAAHGPKLTEVLKLIDTVPF